MTFFLISALFPEHTIPRPVVKLILLPEIALTAEFLTRVEQRFGARPAEWHSGVTMTERRRCWRMVGEGGAQFIKGDAVDVSFNERGESLLYISLGQRF